MNELRIEERQLLSALKEAEGPSNADRDRVYGLVMSQVAIVAGAGVVAAAATKTALASSPVATTALAGGVAAAGVTASTATVPAVAAGGSLLGALATWKAGVAALVVAGAAGGALQMTQPEPVVVPARAPSQVVLTPVVPAPVVPMRAAQPAADGVKLEGEQLTDLPKVEASSASRKAPVAAAKKADLDAELTLLRGAQRALNASDSSTALGLLRRHQKEHPQGVLASERNATMAIALCESGDLAGGSRLAEQMLSGNGASLMASRMRSACKLGTR